MKKLAIASALLSALAITSTAHAYQYEVNAGYENTSIDDVDSDLDTVSISGKYYLNAVQEKGAPLAEAAFLNKASNIGLGYVNVSGDGDEDIDSLGVAGEFFIPNSQFYVSGTINQTDVADEDGNGYSVEVGYLPAPGLLLAVGVADQSESVDPIQAAKYGFMTTFANAAIATGEDGDTAATIRAKYVTQIGNHFANFEAHTYIGDETTYRLGADLYLDPTLSIGASFADSTADESETIFNVRAQKFFTPQVAVGVNYTTVDDIDSFGINGTFRF